ncbi:hypothetical protein D3C80_2030010 [compost metagenome]
MRRRYGAPGVRLIHIGHPGDDLAIGRVMHLELAPVLGLAPTTIYIGERLEQGVNLNLL